MREGPLDNYYDGGEDARDVLPEEDIIEVGDLFFYPPSRKPPTPGTAGLLAYQDAHPDLPIVLHRDTNAERAHTVWAKLVIIMGDDGLQVGVDSNQSPIIRLFTHAIAADDGKLFEPDTHRKQGVQYEGVEIQDWSTVNFHPDYRRSSLFRTWKKVYEDLATYHMI